MIRYAAIGDSFTEGVGDELSDGTVRGWADRVAEGLAAATGEPVSYANLAVRGRLLDDIVTTQVDAVLALDPAPTLVTLNGGGNDLMRPGVAPAALLELVERAVRRLAGTGAELVLISSGNPSARLPFGGTLHRRGTAFTDAVGEVAARTGVRYVNTFADAEVRRPGYWAPDRLHLGATGHQRVADLVLAELGYPDAARALPPEPLARELQVRHWLPAEARFYREHVLPWVGRRLRGRSSGDLRSGKHPVWTTVDPAADRQPPCSQPSASA